MIINFQTSFFSIINQKILLDLFRFDLFIHDINVHKLLCKGACSRGGVDSFRYHSDLACVLVQSNNEGQRWALMKSLLAESANELRNLVKPSNILLVYRFPTWLIVKLNHSHRNVSKAVSVIVERWNHPMVEVLDTSKVVDIGSKVSEPSLSRILSVFLGFGASQSS